VVKIPGEVIKSNKEMSADNGLILNTKDFTIQYYQGEPSADDTVWKCKSLFDAIKKAKELDDEYQTEYGVKLI
jgi:hypothetical protein